MDYGIGGFLLVILPLLFIRTAYLRAFQLQEVSANLLKALVKAIDVRDPYTSGHSQRVSMLSRRIAEAMGLSSTQAKFVETAALLHDIRKIDEIYLEILQKEGPLNVLERRVIQSHVTTGVELLESLSSYPEAVLGAVRHHHERVDGGGYPNGLVGNEIPIGARIIKVADAVDAMLSDRPYRRALQVPVVREELLEFCGTQFDPGVVHAILKSSVLTDHANEIVEAGLNVAETIHGRPLGGFLPSEVWGALADVEALGRSPFLPPEGYHNRLGRGPRHSPTALAAEGRFKLTDVLGQIQHGSHFLPR